MNVFETRIEKLRSYFSQYEVDSIYLTKPEDVAYFTGTKGDDLYLYINLSSAYLITDFRYREMAGNIDWFDYYEIGINNKITDLIKSDKSKKIGICRNSLSLDSYLKFKDILSDKILVPLGDAEYNPVNILRRVKSPEEIDYIHKAQDIGCDAFKHILTYIKPGMTEKQIALELEYYMLSHGADGISFDTICVCGAKSSMPHGVPDENTVKSGDFITMDYGCTYKGYHSDMTRTIAVGSANDEMRNIYEIVLQAQLNACNNIKAGLTGDVCHQFALDVISKAGYGEYFGHGLGHGVGLEIHEAPRFSPAYYEKIEADSVVSIEPGIYLPGKFGVRIEDLAVIKENGIINITSAPKELIII